MSEALTLVVRNISVLATCDPERGAAPGAVSGVVLAAAGDRIAYIGPESGLRDFSRDPSCADVDAQGNAVIPGFVDSHSHLIWMGDRAGEFAQRAEGVTYEAIAAAGGGIRATVRATAAATVEELADAAAVRARRMLRQGTTTVEIKSGYGLATDAELRQLEAARRVGERDDTPDVVTTYLPLHALPGGDRGTFVSDACASASEAATQARFADCFCEEGAFTVAECETWLRAAEAAGMRAKVHAEQRTHSGAALLAARVGAVSADHLDHATDADGRALAGAGVVGTLLPGASLVLGGPPPPGALLRDRGVTLAIATDCNPGTCYSESMPLMVALAVATAGLTPAQALVAATRGGAAALGLEDRGVLAVGKRCDCLILDSSSWIEPAYHLGAGFLLTVIQAGRVAHSA